MKRTLICGLFVALATFAGAAPVHAQSVIQIVDSIDDASLWTPDGTRSPFFSAGFETNVFPFTAPHNAWVMFGSGSSSSDWGTLGRNVRVSTIFPGSRLHTCNASIKVTGSGFFEAIDTATWTYLTPKVNFTGTNGTYKTVWLTQWDAIRPNMFFRVGVSGGGSQHWVRFDDLVLSCVR